MNVPGIAGSLRRESYKSDAIAGLQDCRIAGREGRKGRQEGKTGRPTLL
jgi:hypothetical protein